MRRKTILLATLLMAFCFKSYADEIKTAKSKLEEATVFYRGAELTHSASATLTKGENELKIEGLSPNIDKNSLKIKTSNGVLVSVSELSIDYLSSSKTANLAAKKIQDSIDIYTKQLAQLGTDIKINKELIELLQKGTDKNVSGSDKGLGIDELVKTMEYYKTKAAELETSLANNNKKKEDLEKTIDRLQNQLNQESVKNNKTSGVLKLKLTAPLNTTCTFTISYYTVLANWTPYYDINIASTDQPIKIAMKSKVRQTTGLDWEKVKLTLSTATPSNGKIAPLFSTWFLENLRLNKGSSGALLGIAKQNRYSYKESNVNTSSLLDDIRERNISSSAFVSGPAASPQYMLDGMPISADQFNTMDQNMIKDISEIKNGSEIKVIVTTKNSMDDYITQSENQLNMVYNIDIPYSIPGNGIEQNIDLQIKEASASYKYYCAPKLDTETYLLAEISNWEQLNLLSGKANITYDGTYVGDTYINANSINENLTLTLGTDKRVNVKREKLQDFSSTRFLGSDTKQVFAYKITVRNNQSKTIKMTVKDQYPRSTEKDIEVELLTKDTTTPTANNEEVGVLSWEEELKAGETKVYQISYSVKYPKGRKLNL